MKISNDGQQDIFTELAIPAPVSIVAGSIYEGLDSPDFLTRDIISITDVPISNIGEVEIIDVIVPGVDGSHITLSKPGKIVWRKSPHPTLVQVGDRICSRDSIAKGVATKPVMVPVITTILYEGGIVIPAHCDVLYIIIGLWLARYNSTGNANGKVETSVAEIASHLGVWVQGRTRQMIRDATETIRGLTIIKQYASPENLTFEGASNYIGQVGQRHEVISGILLNTVLEAQHAGGRISDKIIIDLNPALVRAMTGHSIERPWITRGFNFTKNLTYKSPWRRQLARVMEARLELNGRFQMPIIELWVSVLGNDEMSVFGKNWKMILSRIKEVFDEWLEMGWIKNFNWDTRYPKGKELEEFKKCMGNGSKIIGDISYFEMGGWVRCETGSLFGVSKGLGKSVFAKDLALATTDTPVQATALLKEFGNQFIIDIAYGRLKSLLSDIGRRITRLEISSWYGPVYPVPNRMHVARTNFRMMRHGEIEAGSVVGKFDKKVSEYAQMVVAKKVQSISIDEILNDQAVCTVDTPPTVFDEYVLCVKCALECYLEMNEGIPHKIFDVMVRVGNKHLSDIYDRLIEVIRQVAIITASQQLWTVKISERADILSARKPELRRLMIGRIEKLYPASVGIIQQSQMQGRTLWENHIGVILEQRLVEHYLEENYLSERCLVSGVVL